MMYYVLDGKRAVPAKGFDDPRVTALYEDKFEQRRVGLTKVGRITVYTSFLIINHSFFGGPPLVFETMMQDALGRWLDYQERYSTWEEAEIGHLAAIEYAKANPLTLREFVCEWVRSTISYTLDTIRYRFSMLRRNLKQQRNK